MPSPRESVMVNDGAGSASVRTEASAPAGSVRVKANVPASATAITTATELLQSGELVGVFPEGSRAAGNAEALGEAHGGAAFIALRADTPIVPVAFIGTDRVWPRGARFPRLARTSIHMGAPIIPAEVAPGAGRKERVAALTTVVMERIAEELDRARRG